VLRLLLAAVLGIALSVSAQPAIQSIDIGYDQALGLAAKWILENQFGPARQMLEGLAKAKPGDPQVSFLQGQLEFAEGNYGKAVALYRGMLSRDPSLLRVRLELARALFAARDYDAARYHFEIALGQTLDENVRQNIYAFLRAIQGRVSWFSFSVIFGPDSNPNSATSARTIDLLGVPFDVNPDARARKAFGMVVNAQGRYAFGEDNRYFAAGALEYRNYEGSFADSEALELTLGRSVVTGQALWTAEFGPLAAGFQDQELYHGWIARITNALPFGERFLSNSYFSLKRLEYPRFAHLTSDQYWAGTTVRYAIDATSAVWTSATLWTNRAREQPFSYNAVEASVGYSKELPARFNLQVQFFANRYVYDELQPLFGEDRKDRLARLDLAVTARDWTLYGFAPRLSVSTARNTSTIALFSYTRRFAGVGLTREF
jgi:tetratricopeptide (TPR) repeat protein